MDQTTILTDRFVDKRAKNCFKRQNSIFISQTCTDSSQGLYHHPLVFKATGWGLEDIEKNLLEENLLTQHSNMCITNLMFSNYYPWILSATSGTELSTNQCKIIDLFLSFLNN